MVQQPIVAMQSGVTTGGSIVNYPASAMFAGELVKWLNSDHFSPQKYSQHPH